MKLVYFLLILAPSVYGQTENCTTISEDVTEEGKIEFSPYPVTPGNYCTSYTWSAAVDGANVDITIHYLDLDAKTGDFLIISPGCSLQKDETSVVLTGKIENRKFRMLWNSQMYLMLVIQERDQDSEIFKGFSLSYAPFGEIVTEGPPLTPKPTFPTAPEDIDDEAVLYVANIVPHDLAKNITDFKQKMASMANKFCDANKISLLNQTTEENVNIKLITSCPTNWPDWEKCTKFLVSLPVSTEKNTYELTGEHIRAMWTSYGKDLNPMEPFLEPESEEALLIWVYIAGGVVGIFTLVMLTAWKLDLFNSNKNGGVGQFGPLPRESGASTDSWISTSYQEVPPLFYDDSFDKSTIQNLPSPVTTPNTENPKLSDEFKGAMIFGNKLSTLGFDNPTFDIVSEQLNEHSKDNIDDFSSDDEIPENLQSPRSKSGSDHMYEAPKETSFIDNSNESAL